jgi:hypothetical protein
VQLQHRSSCTGVDFKLLRRNGCPGDPSLLALVYIYYVDNIIYRTPEEERTRAGQRKTSTVCRCSCGID